MNLVEVVGSNVILGANPLAGRNMCTMPSGSTSIWIIQEMYSFPSGSTSIQTSLGQNLVN